MTSLGAQLTETVQDILNETRGLSTTKETARIVGDAIVLKRMPQERVLQRNWVGILSQVLGNHIGIGFTGTNHTADRTMITALGPGAQKFAGIHHHTDLFHIFAEFVDVRSG